MDRGRAQAGRRRGGEGGGVVRIPIRQPPDAGVVDGAGAKPLELRQLPFERRQDLVCDDGLRPTRPIAGKPRVLGLAVQGQDQHRFTSRDRAQRLQLRQGQVQAEVRGEDPRGRVTLLAFDVLVHGGGKGVQPVQIGRRIGGGPDLVGVVQEVRHIAIGAVQLADHIGDEAVPHASEPEALAPLDHGAQLEVHRIVVDLPGGREGRSPDRAQGREIGAVRR